MSGRFPVVLLLSAVLLGTGLPVQADPGSPESSVASEHRRPRRPGYRAHVVVRRHVYRSGPHVVVVRRPLVVAPLWTVRGPVVVQWQRTVIDDAGEDVDSGDSTDLEPGDVVVPEEGDAFEELESGEAEEGLDEDATEGVDEDEGAEEDVGLEEAPSQDDGEDGYVFDNERDAFRELERMEAPTNPEAALPAPAPNPPESPAAVAPSAAPGTGADGAVFLADMERQILELVNAERVAAGQGALTNAPLLTVAARRHSREMAELGYFAHDSPTEENRTLAMRLANAGLSNYGWAGENIALSTQASAEEFVRMWMDSPGHRENLLRPDFKFSGIGVYTDGHKTWATQNFTSTN